MNQGPNTANRPTRTRDNFTLLGAEQSPFDGRIQYRIGRQMFLDGTCDFEKLAELKRTQHVAAGLAPIYSDHESLRIYGTSRDAKNNFYDFKLTVEKGEDGLVLAEICVLKGDRVERTIKGFVSPLEGDVFDSIPRLHHLSSDHDNVVVVRNSDGIEEVNLGKVDFLIVDCGVVAREVPGSYRAQHNAGVLAIYFDGELADSAGEFHNLPISTIKQSSIATRFALTTATPALSAQQTRGYIPPANTGLGFHR
jgi:hypothetical protein